MPKPLNRRKWHQQKRWIIGSLLLFPPLGIPLLWLTRWPRAGKISGSILSGVILMSALSGESGESTVATPEPPAVVSVESSKPVEPPVTPAYEDAIAEATAATEGIAVAESSADWERISDQWQSALYSLGDIPNSSSDYSQAQAKAAEYERNYNYAISQKAIAEAAEAEAIAQQQAAAEVAEQRRLEDEAIAQRQEESREAQAALSVLETQDSYVGGNCKELKASGVGSNFRPGDANYTSARDRDGDGIACES